MLHPVTVGPWLTKVKDWLLRMRYAFVGANLPDVDLQIANLQDTVNSLAESVDELEDFREREHEWRENVTQYAYEILDRAMARNNTDWISEAMQLLLVRNGFLADEKAILLDRLTQRPSYSSYGVVGNPYQQSFINGLAGPLAHLKDDAAYDLATQLLKELPNLIEVSQRVSVDSGDTFCEFRLMPKTWTIRNPRTSRNFSGSPVDFDDRF